MFLPCLNKVYDDDDDDDDDDYDEILKARDSEMVTQFLQRFPGSQHCFVSWNIQDCISVPLPDALVRRRH